MICNMARFIIRRMWDLLKVFHFVSHVLSTLFFLYNDYSNLKYRFKSKRLDFIINHRLCLNCWTVWWQLELTNKRQIAVKVWDCECDEGPVKTCLGTKVTVTPRGWDSFKNQADSCFLTYIAMPENWLETTPHWCGCLSTVLWLQYCTLYDSPEQSIRPLLAAYLDSLHNPAPREAFPGKGVVDLPSPGDLKYRQLYLFSFIGSVGAPWVSK